MPSKCYVSWCFTGYDAEKKENKAKKQKNNSLFRAPKDPELRKKWSDAIGRRDRELSVRDSVCELHFADADVERFYETLMPDGSLYKIPKRCRLKRGAIPSVSDIRATPDVFKEVSQVNLNVQIPYYRRVLMKHAYLSRQARMNLVAKQAKTDIPCACGSNDHPDSILFAQVFRLMSTYSLVKPPRRCNVSGSEILSTFIGTHEINNNSEQLVLWQRTLDDVVENSFNKNMEIEGNQNTKTQEDHNYNIAATTDFAQAYFAGYIARKCTNFTKCDLCIQSVCITQGETHTRDKVIDLMSYGYLKHPSSQLFNLLKLLEREILQVISTQDLNKDTFFAMSEKIGELDALPLIGCAEHNHFLTKHVCQFYLVTKSHFISKRYNQINNAKRKKTRRDRKNAKL